jgi:hypothetical protein
MVQNTAKGNVQTLSMPIAIVHHTGQIEVQCSKLGSKSNTVTYRNIIRVKRAWLENAKGNVYRVASSTRGR